MRFLIMVLSACMPDETTESGCDLTNAIETCTIVRPAENGPQDLILIGTPTYENKAGRPTDTVQLDMIAAVIEGQAVGLVTNAPEEHAAYATRLVSEYGVSQDVVDENLIDIPVEHTDVWFRDMGGVFVHVTGGDVRTQAVVDFNFDGWGYGPYSDDYQNYLYAIDNEVAAGLGEALGLPVITSDLTTEGGAFQSNGAGTTAYSLLALEQRNPGWTQEAIETELKRTLGAKKLLAVPTFHPFDGHSVLDGPLELDGTFYHLPITVRHADEFMQFVDADTILVATLDEADVTNPLEQLVKDHLDEIWAFLEASTDQDGNPFELVPFPDPGFLSEEMAPGDVTWDYLGTLQGLQSYDPAGGHIVMPASYMNFVITNDVVLVPKFYKEGRPERLVETDEQARAILAERFAPRTVVQIDNENIVVGGGGMHCISQEVRSL